MNTYIDYPGRITKIREEMKMSDLDLFAGTRTVSLSYVSGAFVPWRSAVIVSKDGHAGLVSMLLDCERLKNESWLGSISSYVPLPGMDLMVDIFFKNNVVYDIKSRTSSKTKMHY